MPTERIVYVDPDAVGTGTGTSLANAYTSLVACITAEVKDLVTADEVLAIECHSSAGTADTGGTPTISASWTTDATRFIWVRPYTGNEASTARNDTKYRLQTSTASVNAFRDFRIDNIQIMLDHTSSQTLYSLRGGGAGYREIRKCFIEYTGSGGSGNRVITFGSDVALLFSNNIVKGIPQEAILNTRSSAPVSYYYDNTFISCATNISYSTTDLAVLKGNLSSGSTNDFVGTYGAGTDYNASDNASLGYTVTGGGNTHDRLSQTFTFAGASDYALDATDAGARTYGVDLSSDPNIAVTDDIDGNVRLGTIDIGAHQVSTGGLVIDTPPSEILSQTSTSSVISTPDVTPTTGNTEIKFDSDSGQAATVDSVTGSDPYTINYTFPRTTAKLFSETGYPLYHEVASENVTTSAIPYIPISTQFYVDLVSPVNTAGTMGETYSGATAVTGDQWVYDTDSGNFSVDAQGYWTMDVEADVTINYYLIQADGTVGPNDTLVITTSASGSGSGSVGLLRDVLKPVLSNVLKNIFED